MIVVLEDTFPSDEAGKIPETLAAFKNMAAILTEEFGKQLGAFVYKRGPNGYGEAVVKLEILDRHEHLLGEIRQFMRGYTVGYEKGIAKCSAQSTTTQI